MGSKKINSLKCVENKNLYVCARDINFQGFDLEKNQVSWKAKNLPRDELDLVQKIFHVSSIFTQESNAYVLSGFNQVLLYDIRAQKKVISVFKLNMDEEGLLTCFDNFSDTQFAVGNNMGSVGIFDHRKSFQMVKRLNSCLGGVTDIKKSPKEDESFAFGNLISITRPPFIICSTRRH